MVQVSTQPQTFSRIFRHSALTKAEIQNLIAANWIFEKFREFEWFNHFISMFVIDLFFAFAVHAGKLDDDT